MLHCVFADQSARTPLLIDLVLEHEHAQYHESKANLGTHRWRASGLAMRQFGRLAELVVDGRRRRSGTRGQTAIPAASLGLTAGVGIRNGLGDGEKAGVGE